MSYSPTTVEVTEETPKERLKMVATAAVEQAYERAMEITKASSDEGDRTQELSDHVRTLRDGGRGDLADQVWAALDAKIAEYGDLDDEVDPTEEVEVVEALRDIVRDAIGQVCDLGFMAQEESSARVWFVTERVKFALVDERAFLDNVLDDVLGGDAELEMVSGEPATLRIASSEPAEGMTDDERREMVGTWDDGRLQAMIQAATEEQGRRAASTGSS